MQILFAVAPIVNFRGGGGGAEGEEAVAADEERHYPELAHERADERGDEHAIGDRDSSLADSLALYIAELVLQEYSFAQKKISRLAVCIVAVARSVALDGASAWDSTLADASGYERSALELGCVEVWRLYRNACDMRNDDDDDDDDGTSLKMIHQRYREAARRGVAYIIPPRTLPMSW